jgi:hypothetical protein
MPSGAKICGLRRAVSFDSSMPAFRLGAIAVLLVHLAFVLFVVLGGLLVLRWRGVAWVHLPAAVWGAAIEFSGRVCPLTPLENWFRQRGGQAPYSGDFIEHYITAVIYPSGLTRTTQLVLGALVVALNATIYGWMIFKRRRG